MSNKRGKNNFIFVIIIIGIVLAGYFMTRMRGKSSAKSAERSFDVSSEIDRVKNEGAWPPVSEEEVLLEKNLLTRNYYIVFDGSGSMDGNKLDTAKKALKEFTKAVPDDANLGMVVFDERGISERVELTNERNSFFNAIDAVVASGSTPLRRSIEIAYSKMMAQGRKQLGYGEYNLVIVTDGEATDGNEPDGIVNVILNDSPIVIHTIGFQIGTNHSLNQPGKIYYKSANNFEELTKGLESVLAESEDFTITDFK